ncbi:helicase-related protein [Deinococcus aluminii]|uniref:Helicase C-terminal domain-containing protein n=1 Tax=Deinococcus aluminii TaxID=1656885 RepID=A0ABP9XEQ4_9DEIO
MNKGFALASVTSVLALFGLNLPGAFPERRLQKRRPARPHVLPLNGQLLDTRTPWTPGITQPAPAPSMDPYGVEASGSGEAARRAANQAAQDAIFQANPDPAVLRAYSGGGGIGESVDQYYTPGMVAGLMWDVLAPFLPLSDEKKTVRALEPACGNGAILARAPEGVHLTAVEMDPVAARAAARLHPHASVHTLPFESYATRSGDALFDVGIANPPYGPRGETRILHEDKETRSERYVLRNLIRRVQFQSGLISVLIPLSLLHGKSHQNFREELLTYALPLHAVLVPSGAFRAAGAGVTTVLLVLRRHDHGVQEALSTLTPDQTTGVLAAFTTDPWHKQLVQQFADGSSLIQTEGEDGQWTHRLREKAQAFRFTKSDTLRAGRFGEPLLEGDVDATDFIRGSILNQMQDAMKAAPTVFRVVIETVRELVGEDAAGNAEDASHGASLHAIAEGTLSGDRRFVFRLGAWVPTDDFSSPVISAAVQVAQGVQAYLEALAAGRPETASRRSQALALDAAYRASHGGYDRPRLSRLVDRYSLFAVLLAHLNTQGRLELAEPENLRLPVTATDLAGVAEQLADLLALTEETLAEYAGCSEQDAAAHLTAHYAFNGQIWIEPGLYYAGHAFQKAEQARLLAEQFTGYRRTALLKQADTFISRVRRTPLADLKLSPRDTVIPLAALEAWVNDFLGSDADGKTLLSVRRENGAVRFFLKGGAGEGGRKARDAFDQSQARELEAYLNHKTEVAQVRGAKDMSKEEYRAERAMAIDEAQAYEDRVSSHFGNWLLQSPFQQAVEDAYTYARGAVLRPEGSTRPLNIPDWKGPALHPYQAMDVRVMAATTGMVNNYNVGLGKTFSLLALVAFLKACGRASRPMIVVPAGLVSNWATNAALALPGWNVVTVGMSVKRDKHGRKVYKKLPNGADMLDERGRRIEQWTVDSPAVKREKIASLSAGKVDLIIMSREAFTGIPMLRETRERMIRTDPQFLRNLETQDRYEAGPPKRGKHAQLARQVGAFGAMLARTKIAREGELSFELLGCDFIGYDEAHGLKNLASPPQAFGETPRFLGGGGESQRALDALHKGRYVRERGGSTFSFTASWVKNSPIEVWAMLSQVTDCLPEYGLATNDALMEQYLRIEPQIVTGMDGSVDVKPCVVGFRRLKELKGIIAGHVITRDYGDPEVVTGDGKLLAVPAAVPEEVMIDMTPEQAELYKVLRERARAADGRGKGENHTFSILWEMRKLTVDPALKGLSGPNPRFEKIAELALENRASGGKGIVFLSIGEKEGSFERLKRVLVQAGYPEREIAIVSSNTHKSSVERQNLEDDYNYGHLTLILGTDVLGQGFNLQRGTTLIVNADIPWNYEEIRQRVGRGARQGNTAERVRNVYLLMRGSFDTITYTIMSGKKSWLAQLWTDVDELENTGADFNGEMMALLLSDDPEQTRREIVEKKEKLEELTGRAALRRNLEVLARVLSVRDRIQTVRERASARKQGWTAHDHALMTQAREAFIRVRRELDLLGDFSFTRLLDYAGELHWVGVLPVHVGMTFLHEGARVEVTQVTSSAVNATTADGGRLALSFRQVMGGSAFEASTHPQHYREAAALLHQPTISLPEAAVIHALDARQVNPVPRDPEGVITVSVKGDEISLHATLDKFLLRSLLITGHVVMHYAVKTEGEHLTVTQVAVLSNDPAVVAGTQKQVAVPRFRERLLGIAATAMNASPIRDRAHAA